MYIVCLTGVGSVDHSRKVSQIAATQDCYLIFQEVSSMDLQQCQPEITANALFRTGTEQCHQEWANGSLESQAVKFEDAANTSIPSRILRAPQLQILEVDIKLGNCSTLQLPESPTTPNASQDAEEQSSSQEELRPFLLRFPVSAFGICLGLGSQSMLWRAYAHEKFSRRLLLVSAKVNLTFWCVGILGLFLVSTIYLLKSFYYFEAVRKEFHHPVRTNFFFAPWIALMFLAIGLPAIISETLPPGLFYVLITPLVLLELKLYGEWLSGGARQLSKVANASCHLAVVGNFVGSILAGRCGLKEPALFLWAVGLAFYLVLFVTLYQRLPTNQILPKDLHPVYFLFVAAPCTASVAWMGIHGNFDAVSKIVFFFAIWLYCVLVVRVKFFLGFRFSIAWWAFAYPLTSAALASSHYANAVHSIFPYVLFIGLTCITVTAQTTIFIGTLLHAFLWRNLFPNDTAIEDLIVFQEKNVSASIIPRIRGDNNMRAKFGRMGKPISDVNNQHCFAGHCI